MGMRPPRSLTIPDGRGRSASLRITRHAEQRKVVISHWRDDVCVASSPIEVGELPALIGVLADALGDAARVGDSSSAASHSSGRRTMRFIDTLRQWLRPRLAHVVDIGPPRDEAAGERTA
jgi:hypothetical protein